MNDLERLQESAERAGALLKAMANAHRLMILCKLIEGEKSVGALERAIGLSQSAMSQHLARLKRDALVKTRRDGKMIYYSINGKEAEAVLQTLCGLFCTAP